MPESNWENFKQGVEDIFEFKNTMQKQWAGVQTAPPYQKPPEKRFGFKHFTLNIGEKAKKYTKRKAKVEAGGPEFLKALAGC